MKWSRDGSKRPSDCAGSCTTVTDGVLPAQSRSCLAQVGLAATRGDRKLSKDQSIGRADVRLSRFFDRRAWHAPPATYAYDFGDDWQHVVVHEGMESAEDALSYPRCIGGARRCPPEDCGGVHGYAEFLQTIANPRHPEHHSTLRWAGGEYDPDAFDPSAIVFDNPRKRWKKAFER